LKGFGFFKRIFERLYFCMVKYLSFHNSSFALRYVLMSMARPHCDTPLVYFVLVDTEWVPHPLSGNCQESLENKLFKKIITIFTLCKVQRGWLYANDAKPLAPSCRALMQ
jgi:hypothetical protein